ncbi:S24 family peptidase [Nitratidesulfovibrio sp. D1]|uniref:S24 family peptidase n=1 Tax=Nitratidesulfovibrio sp. D1 TaxID=3440151 RepID=UPI003EC0E8E8
MNEYDSTGTDWDELREFVVDALRSVGGVKRLAEIAGVSERTVYAWKNGERFPSRTNLARLTEHLERIASTGAPSAPQPHWRGLHERMLRPYGESPRDAHAPAGQDVPEEARRLAEEFVLVDKAEARPSAGGGSLQTGGRPEEQHAFRLDWVLGRARSTTGLCLMEVMGRSMERTLHDGDLVLVNQHDRTLAEDRVYVLRVQDEIYIKRFSRTPGRYHFRGDNPELAYQDIEIDPRDEALQWEVIGRVIWAGKEM